MGTIRLHNRWNRPFVAELETTSEGRTHKVNRLKQDGRTGERGVVEAEYQTHDTLTILGGKVSDPLDESVLQNHQVGRAVQERRLRVIRD